jgi:hypothetical protein
MTVNANVKSMSNTQLKDYVTRQYEEYAPQVMSKINRWLQRGDGVAIYENHDLSHPDLGQCQIVSFGSPAAQLETDVPPEILPDIGSAINWRYVLVATCGRTPA